MKEYYRVYGNNGDVFYYKRPENVIRKLMEEGILSKPNLGYFD